MIVVLVAFVIIGGIAGTLHPYAAAVIVLGLCLAGCVSEVEE